MNITFLIGNGFDLNLGLHTKYTDFIEEYTRENPSDSPIISNFKRDLLDDKKNNNFWSNAELAIGQYSRVVAQSFGKNAAEIYCDLHDDFCEKLATYLESEQSRVNIDKLKSQFIQSFNKIANGFTPVKGEEVASLVKKAGADLYSLIIFNYTTIIDQLLVNNKKIGTHSYRYANGLVSFEDSIADFIHIHGTITNSMAFGVNDISQIAVPQIFEGYPSELKSTFIKKDFNEMAEEGTFDKAQTILNKSDLIYIYGMSLGQTDRIWWEQICQLLKNRPRLRVVIHSIDMPDGRLIPRRRVTHENTHKDRLLAYAPAELEVDEDVLGRVYVTGFNIFESLTNQASNTLPKKKAV